MNDSAQAGTPSPPIRQRKTICLHLLGLAILSGALYLPNLGRGFIHDDFVWLHDAAFHPPGNEISLFSPLGLATFGADWRFWGLHAFPMGVENLILHIGNSLLLYLLVFLLWGSPEAAWWGSFGFALLFPANTWAAMWIALRAHLLATLFFQAALCTAVWYARTTRHLVLAGTVTLALAAAAMMSKESGIMTVLAIPILLAYLRGGSSRPLAWRGTALLMVALVAVAAMYLALRARGGGTPVISDNPAFRYVFSANVFTENLLRYAWRTYGLQSLLAGALILSFRIRGGASSLDRIDRRAMVLSGLLFLVALAPMILIRDRSGMYSYLPAVGASLLFGTVARSLYEKRPPRPWSWISAAPVLAIAAIYAGFAVGQSVKWRYMAETNQAVLQQIARQLPRVDSGALIVLRSDGIRDRAQLMSSFATWGFAPAMQLLYRDPTLKAVIVQAGEKLPVGSGLAPIEFLYQSGPDFPRSIRVTPK